VNSRLAVTYLQFPIQVNFSATVSHPSSSSLWLVFPSICFHMFINHSRDKSSISHALTVNFFFYGIDEQSLPMQGQSKTERGQYLHQTTEIHTQHADSHDSAL